MFSVIIPVYNAADTLDKCIASILTQKMQDFEVLLIDDGSTDDSYEICKRLAEKDNRIRVFHQANAGASAARNLGLDNANGDWVCFIDADDYIEGEYLPLRIESHIELYLQNESINGQDQYKKVRIPDEGMVMPCVDFLQEYAHTSIFRGVCSKFCRMDIIRKEHLRFNAQQRHGEDLLFFLQYVKFCKTVQFLYSGTYTYIADEEWVQKYNYSREEAYSFFDDFVDAYRGLPFPLPQLARTTYDIYEQLANKGVNTPLSWKLNPSVLAVKKLQIPVRNQRYQLHYIIARVLSIFYPAK